jgi:hypothetical protein
MNPRAESATLEQMSVDRRTFLSLCAAFGLGALAACSNTSDAGTGADAARGGGGAAADPGERAPIASVVVLGDSISRATDEEYHATFAKAGISDVRVEAEVGRRIEVGNGKGAVPLSGVRTLFGLLADKVAPDAWVIELGTNDIGSYPDAEAYAGLIDQILGMLPVDVGEHVPPAVRGPHEHVQHGPPATHRRSPQRHRRRLVHRRVVSGPARAP